jgi:hypothetical protein
MTVLGTIASAIHSRAFFSLPPYANNLRRGTDLRMQLANDAEMLASRASRAVAAYLVAVGARPRADRSYACTHGCRCHYRLLVGMCLCVCMCEHQKG